MFSNPVRGRFAVVDATELLALMHRPDRSRLLMRAEFDEGACLVRITAGDGVTSVFDPRELDDPDVDPDQLQITDGGAVLKLGSFAVAAESLLELADPAPSARRTC